MRSAAGVYSTREGIESAKLYGNVNAYAYYFTDLLIGWPHPQRVSVIIDTGSSLCGFPCEGCRHCGHHIDPPFQFTDSKTAHWITCVTEWDCSGRCDDGFCTYEQDYTEGSSIRGLWFRDIVQLGDAMQENPPVNATLGCHTDERKLFYTQRVNGIMGMAPHTNNGRPTILQDLFIDREHVNTGVFSICLADWGGKLSVGGFEPEYHVDPGGVNTTVQWIPLMHSGYYSVAPAQLEMGDAIIASGVGSFGTALVDSGTTFSYLPALIYGEVRRKLHELCGDNACHARRDGGDCWRLEDGASLPSHFPMMTMQFQNGERVRWPPRAYLFNRGEPTFWCEAFANNGADADTVLGVSWMLHKDVIFDLTQSRLGVVEARCPEYRHVPGESAADFPSRIAGARRSWALRALLLMTTVSGIVIAVAALMWLRSANYCGDRRDACCTEEQEESLVESREGSPTSASLSRGSPKSAETSAS